MRISYTYKYLFFNWFSKKILSDDCYVSNPFLKYFVPLCTTYLLNMKTIAYLFPFFACAAFAQQPTAILEDDWQSNQWKLNSGKEFSYNTADLPTEKIRKLFHEPALWTNDTKEVLTYDSADKLVQTIFVYHDGADWTDTSYREIYTYDAQGRLVNERSQWYFPSYWEDNEQTLYIYSGADTQPQTRIYQLWNSGTSLWENSVKNAFGYNGNLINDTLSSWESGAWVTLEHTLTTLNGSNQAVSEITEGYFNNAWMPGSQVFFHYTPFGKLASRAYWVYNDSIQNFVPSDSTFLTYNPDETVDWQVSFQFDNNQWKNLVRFRYFYEGSLEIADQETPKWAFSPNPTTQWLTITTETKAPFALYVTDVNGRILLRETVTNALQTIDISRLPDGLYYVNIDQDGTRSQQLVKQ